MLGNFKNEDERTQKTNEALMGAMSKLLDLRNFNKITIIALCEEAQIGRATFYYHFQDKYDLLKQWLINTNLDAMPERTSNKNTDNRISTFVNNNGKIIRHLIEDANNETLELLCNFILLMLDMDTDNGHMSPKYTVLFKFCCGGIMNYLEWQAKNQSKSDLKMMNSYFYDILNTLNKWNEEHK